MNKEGVAWLDYKGYHDEADQEGEKGETPPITKKSGAEDMKEACNDDAVPSLEQCNTQWKSLLVLHVWFTNHELV